MQLIQYRSVKFGRPAQALALGLVVFGGLYLLIR